MFLMVVRQDVKVYIVHSKISPKAVAETSTAFPIALHVVENVNRVLT